MKIVDIITESSTKLIANKKSWAEPDKRNDIQEIKTLLLAVIEARGKVLIDLNVHEKNLDAVIEALPAMKKPTVSKLYKSDYYAVETVISKNNINILIPKLKAMGAEDILELDISKIVH
ncbi:MAG: ATP phosphoribosyltransferase [ANME-2 cluster archaeon HR1]|nr:MAG: ATP phosphoribosyltransferase [ANME-2 cluster archaeon HR1]